MKKIIEVTWNWSPACMESNGDRIDYYSDTCETAHISNEKVLKIEEHIAMGEGDKFFYDIFFVDGTVHRIFNPNTVYYTVASEGNPL